MCGFCNVWVCLYVEFVMRGCMYVWDFQCVGLCICGVCNVRMYVCVGFVMCGCVYVCEVSNVGFCNVWVYMLVL